MGMDWPLPERDLAALTGPDGDAAPVGPAEFPLLDKVPELQVLRDIAAAEASAPRFSPAKIGRRHAARLRVSLPGQMIGVEKVQPCILLNLSRTGAQVAILESLRIGEGAIVRCGAVNQFGVVTRSEFGLNALEFEEMIDHELVLEIRRYHENFEERERRALIETARNWVSGETDDERPI